MQIYNTMTRQKEELKPITPGTVKIYACGPTVYNLIHIGNARALCVFDTLRRYLEFRGYKVFYVQNFTDVDDKIIKKANERGFRECYQRILHRRRRSERTPCRRSPKSNREHGYNHRHSKDPH